MNAAADFWREQCFFGDRSLFWQANLWTLKNPSELQPRIEKPKPGGDENYVQKLKTQLAWVCGTLLGWMPNRTVNSI